jgi:hypothetical protein
MGPSLPLCLGELHRIEVSALVVVVSLQSGAHEQGTETPGLPAVRMAGGLRVHA